MQANNGAKIQASAGGFIKGPPPGQRGWRMRMLAEHAVTLSLHQHQLPRVKLNSLEMQQDGKTVYTFDASGSYYCRACNRLGYGMAHHCSACYPSFDICEACFQRQKILDLGATATTRVNFAIAEDDCSPAENSSDEEDPFRVFASSKPSQPTSAALLASAQAHEFTALLAILFPNHSQEDLAAEAQGLEFNKVDYTIRDGATGRTMLHYASEAGADRVVLGLLMHVDDDVKNGQDHQGLTPLMIGAMLGKSSVVEELLYGAAHTATRCRQGYTALMLAVSYGWADTTSRLIFSGADVHASAPSTGRNSLMIGCLNGSTACVQRLLQCEDLNRFATDNEGYTGILLAAAVGGQDIVDLFPEEDRASLKW